RPSSAAATRPGRIAWERLSAAYERPYSTIQQPTPAAAIASRASSASASCANSWWNGASRSGMVVPVLVAVVVVVRREDPAVAARHLDDLSAVGLLHHRAR